MEQQCRFSYNELDDSLIVSCRGEHEQMRESFMFDRFIFSVAESGNIVGIQILDASSVFVEHCFNPEILHEILAARLTAVSKENCIFIGLSITSSKGVANLPIRVFVPRLQIEA